MTLHFDTLATQLRDALAADNQQEADRLITLIDQAETETKARLEQPGALLAAALYYANRGWAVFPCKPGQKVPATRHGLKDATTDEDEIRYWWQYQPDYNIGLPTGTHFDVIDIDGQLGMESLRKFMRTTVPDTPDHDWTNTDDVFPTLGTVLTPRRPGTHRYVAPTGAGNKAAMGNQLPGIDYRGAGGYVLAPPSRTEHGMYVWARPIPTNAA